MTDNQESPSKELDVQKGDVSLKGRVNAFMNGRYGQTQAVVDLVGALWAENQHLRDWTRKNIKEESEWATKYMQVKEQLTATQQALDSAVEALKKKKDEVQTLWMLLDDIDTLDDAARENDAAFRKNCYEIQQKRWLIADPFSIAALASIKE